MKRLIVLLALVVGCRTERTTTVQLTAQPSPAVRPDTLRPWTPAEWCLATRPDLARQRQLRRSVVQGLAWQYEQYLRCWELGAAHRPIVVPEPVRPGPPPENETGRLAVHPS